ncbi:scavenger receptor cysteine-rich type 1 protein M160-like [Chiloscyllium punctatum]|uniref:scavenger receptor cysteine-rich type 1 protein M160-like n=1 Tax=Chiloscyllium punctatum TaxID=137246 RepID=UPI003B632F34
MTVVCRMLNCGRALSGGDYGNGSGKIWLDNVTCLGTESALSQCSANPWEVNTCINRKDAGVTCSGPMPLRLVNGTNMCSGRVEVYRNSVWGTICDNGWDINAAEVVCRVLNCGTALSAQTGSYYGAGSGNIWVSGVKCLGTEPSLDQCSVTSLKNCTHSQDAGVICSGPVPVRLVNGTNMCSGRVEVYRNSIWGTVCDNSWDKKAASVVCRVLNCGTALSAPKGAYYGYGSGHIWLDDVKCNGTESALDQCSANPQVGNNCTHGQDAGVTCSGPISVRLVNGTNMCSGRVEVYRNSIWGTICDNGWNLNAASVVCRVLNCGKSLSITRSAYYGEGSGVILLDNVNCTGTEPALDQCSANPKVGYNCTHKEDAGVICSGPVPVRLVNGPNVCSGRVEVYHNFEWGTICDNGWNENAPSVVCRVLNCGSALSAPGGTYYGNGSGAIWMDNVRCNGNESALDQCSANPQVGSNCTHRNDIGVVCSGPVSVRLVNGTNMCSGRVEVYRNSFWGTICDNSWDKNESDVVCRMLNCGTAVSAPGGSQYGAGTGNIWLDSVNCSGTETALDQCPANPQVGINCTHSRDAAVICSGPVPIRLMNGINVCSGRVEVYRKSSWGAVCDSSSAQATASIVCRGLNCGAALLATNGSYYSGEGTGIIWLDNMQCVGTEPALDQCIANPRMENNCTQGQNAEAVCSGPVPIRLVNGPSMCSGRVEIYRNSAWGTICDNGWNIRAASVVCRMLNCGTALSAPGGAYYGEGTGDIWLNDVRCNGTEPALDQCLANPWVGNNCAHSQDAGVACSGPVPIRLVNGPSMCSGRVEIYRNSTWGTICNNSWNIRAASVVCRMLNCGTALSAPGGADYGEGTGVIWLDDVRCNGTEPALDQCLVNPWVGSNCTHSQDAEVTCSGPVPVQLVNGTSMCSGRVEVYHDSDWGTVCANGWDTNAMTVVCRMLNCGRALSGGDYGNGSGKIWLDNVTCLGTESALSQCSANPWEVNTCINRKDAGVTCSGPMPLRLVNGTNMCSGRVEVYRNSVWGTICDNGWDINAAEVVCRVLNCGTALSAQTGSYYGAGSGNIWVSGVKCLGTEPSLDQCSVTSLKNCTHSQDAGVICSGPVPVRLVNGTNMCSGRVEVYRNSIWGTVCDNSWDKKAASVVCRVLNCGTALSAPKGAYYGYGSGHIWLDDVKCNGTESTLDQCSANPQVGNNCTHGQDAGVTCSGPISVRLVNGTNMCSGRVEVYRNSIWGTICDNGWNLNAASVVCRVLNCGKSLSITRSAYYGEGSGVILLDNVNCTGTEPALDQCSANPKVGYNCTHKEDAGVICSGPVPVRLVNGPNVCSGRVEVYRNFEWGTICDNGWNENAPSVVCRVLNCGSALSAPGGTYYGNGSGAIWMDNVRCNGNESALDQCSANPQVGSNCTHRNDIGVVCSGPVSVRLVNGTNMCSGRVEVYRNSFWGTICDNSWDKNESDVVCRMLNCGTAVSAPGGSQYGAGTGNIWLDSVNCSGTETALDQCPANPQVGINCTHSRDAAVICSGPVPIRLMNGINMCSGRVEVYRKSSWGAVCDSSSAQATASIVCRGLNCGAALSATNGSYYSGEGTGIIWLDNMQCVGTEPALDQCIANPRVENNCTQGQNAEAVCSGPVPIRLVNGPSMCSGRVEIYRNSAWGTICDNGWNIRAASVVCRMLNCGTALSAPGGAYYGEGTGDIWLNDVRCNGTEPALDQCLANPWVGNNCAHSQDAGVACSGPVPIRLVNGPSMCSGRVEIYRNSTWGTICNNSWNIRAASVVCRMLNCGTALSAPGGADYGEGTGVIWLDDVRCNGTEPALDQCLANPWVGSNCTHSQDAEVTCSGPVPIRLVGGITICSGRVEVYRNSSWGTVCDAGWNINAANVTCRALNCGTALSERSCSCLSEATGKIWMANVTCSGTEPTLDQCSSNPLVESMCNHSQDASVICSAVTSMRLVRGNNICSGRVEVYRDSTWGTICDNGWDINEAKVVCRVLNCGTAVSATSGTYYGEGTGRIWLDNVSCDGTESVLAQCSAKSAVARNCTSKTLAGVICSGPLPIRLVNNTHMCSGRVEIYGRSGWRNTCNNSWDLNSANVVCRMLNCGKVLKATTYLQEGTANISMFNIRCTGKEAALDQCAASVSAEQHCTHRNVAGVICSGSVKTLSHRTCLTQKDVDQKRVVGRVHFSLTGGNLCPSDPQVTETLKKVISSILASIRGGRLLKVEVNPSLSCVNRRKTQPN